MKQEFKFDHVIQVLILVLAFVFMIMLWPCKIIQEKVSKTVEAAQYQRTEVLTENASVMQQFVPSQEHLDTIQVKVDSLEGTTGLFKLHLYDQSLNLIWEDGRRFYTIPGTADYLFHVDTDLVIGQPYYYTIDYDSASFKVCYTDRKNAIASDNGILYYDLKEIPDSQVISEYQYKIPYSSKRLIAYNAAILFAAFFLMIIVKMMKRFGLFKKEITGNRAVHVFAGTFAGTFIIYVLYRVWADCIFSTARVENIILSGGIILAGIICIYGITRFRMETILLEKEMLLSKIPACLQTVFWGMAILACCDFVNAGSNYAQGLALREMCIYFGFAVITMFSKKDILHLWNAVYVVAALIAIVFYSRMFAGQGEPFQTAVRTAIMWGVSGIVFINTIYQVICKKIAVFSLPFAGIVLLFFGMLILFRNSNIWEIAVVVPFSLLYIRRQDRSQMDRMLGNICNGVIFSFLITTVQALLHRPFHYYTMTRYSGIFMTVTVTAVYLGMVFGAVLCKLINKYEKCTSLNNIWKELVLLGLVCGYEFISLSRTGMLTCVAVYVITCVIYLLFHWRQKIHLVRFVIYTVLAIICCLPITYAVTRTIPAVVNRPTIYLGEEFQDSIRVGEPIDSFRYITIEKVLGVSLERMLGKKDLSYVTQSGKTVEEVLEEAQQNTEDVIEEDGITIDGDKLTYVDDYGDEYTIDNADYSNGRLTIYKKYLKNLNMTGHKAIGLQEEDGTMIIHAHNSFIQMAYDCGILTGIIFLVLYVVLGIRSIWYYGMRKDTDQYSILPVIMFAAFGISSMVEYVFRPTIPLGFVFLLMIAPLIIRLDQRDVTQNGAELEQK